MTKLYKELDHHFIQFEEDDYRVFFINTYSIIGRQIICQVSFSNMHGSHKTHGLQLLIAMHTLQAYLRGYTHPKYVWVTYGWYQDRWWTEEVNPEPTNCTDHQLAEVLHRSLALQLIPDLNELNATTDTGLVSPKHYNCLYIS